MTNRTLLPACALLLCASVARAQTVRPLLRVGDPVPGMNAALTNVATLAINDAGTWIAEVDTNFATGNEDGALLRNGLLGVREGIALAQPPGAVHNEFVDVNVTRSGDLGLVMTFNDFGVIPETGVFRNLVPVVVSGDPFDQPGIAPNSVWDELIHAKLNSNGEMLVFGEIVTPGSPIRKHTLARYRVDENGSVTSVEVLASKGLPVAALGGDRLNVIPNNSGATSQNQRGDYLCVVDGMVGAPALLLNMETVLAQVGSPSPVAGQDWKFLDRFPRTSINDFGDYVFTGSTEHPDPQNSGYVIIKSGEVFAQEGDVVGSFSTAPMGVGSGNPVLISNSGDVFWYWQNRDRTESALMRNHEPIVQANATHVGPDLVVGIPTQDNFHVSPDGRFWIGRVDVENLGETILLMDFGLVVPIPGCQANPGRLSHADGMALPGDHLELAMDNGQQIGVRPILFFSSTASVPGSPCGIATPFGELLISLQSRFGRVILPTWDGTSPSSVDLPIPNDVALINAELYAQGLFVDVLGTPAEDFRATNALRIQIGAP